MRRTLCALPLLAVSPVFAADAHSHEHCDEQVWETSDWSSVTNNGGRTGEFMTSVRTGFFFGDPPETSNYDCRYEISDLQWITFLLKDPQGNRVRGEIVGRVRGHWDLFGSDTLDPFSFTETPDERTIGGVGGGSNLDFGSHPGDAGHLDIALPQQPSGNGASFIVEFTVDVGDSVVHSVHMSMGGSHYYVPSAPTALTLAAAGFVCPGRRRRS